MVWEVSGNPEGAPVLVIHGGPAAAANPITAATSTQTTGASSSSNSGCGRSTPWAELEDNTTMASVSDIEQLGEHLGIEAWVVFGGSWGSSLSLIYAQHHPERVNTSCCAAFSCAATASSRGSTKRARATSPTLRGLPQPHSQSRTRRPDARLPRSADLRRRGGAARCSEEWTRWEMATSYLIPKASAELKADDLQFAVAFARIECHYFTNGVFMLHNFILDHGDRLSDIPIDIVQGRYDVVCPARSA